MAQRSSTRKALQVLRGKKSTKLPECHLKHLFKTLASLANQTRSVISGFSQMIQQE